MKAVGARLPRYDGVGHGFQGPAHTKPVERAAAEDSWNKTFRFLDSFGLAPATVT